jgi:hypothetical protein
MYISPHCSLKKLDDEKKVFATIFGIQYLEMSPDFKRIIVLWQNAIVFQGSILLIHFRHVSGVKQNSRWRKKYMFFWEPFWQICLTEILEWNFAWNTRLKKFVNCKLIKSAPRGDVAASLVNKSIRTLPLNVIWNCWNFVPINVLLMYHWEKSLLWSDVFSKRFCNYFPSAKPTIRQSDKEF